MLPTRRRTICSVAKCKSGRNSEKAKRRKLGLRQLSLFGVPKDVSLREKWSEILGQPLADIDCVCELHFSADAIDRYHNVYFPNGVVQKFEKGRYSLKPKAIPLREKRESEKENNEATSDVVTSYIKLEIVGSHSLYIEDQKHKEYRIKQNRVDQINELLSLSDVNIGLNEIIADEVIDLTDPDPIYRGLQNSSEHNTNQSIESPTKLCKKSDINSSKNDDIEVPVIHTKPQDDHCYYFKNSDIENSQIEHNSIKQPPISQGDPTNCNSTRKMPLIKSIKTLPSNQNIQNLKMPIITNVMSLQSNQNIQNSKMPLITNVTTLQSNQNIHNSKMPLIKNVTTLQSNQNIHISNKRALTSIGNTPDLQKNEKPKSHKKRKVDPANTEAPQKFSLHAIRDYFVKNPLPKSWTWIENKKFNGVVFVQVNRVTQQIRCYVECKEDLSIEVSTFDGHKINSMDSVVTSVDDILNYLMKVYNLRLCEAYGVHEKRSEKCTFMLSEEERYKKKMPVDRCSNCRNEKKLKSTPRVSELHPKINVSKTRELSQKLYQATKSVEYYREKCDSMKEMLQNLKKLCVTMQSTAKKTALDEAISQLPTIQQDVVRACFDSANVDPRARRYEPNYVHECFLLKVVSNAAYDHIKKRNLIPLPCETTLNAIVGGESKT